MKPKKETDIFVKIQAVVDAAKAADLSWSCNEQKFDAFDNVKLKLKPLCEDMSTWTSCKDCPVPCKDDEGPLILQLKIDEDT